MSEWVWIRSEIIYAIHAEQLAEHGGLPGLRDEGGLESAMSRPLNLAHYGDPDVFELAAAYAYGIARNHPFADGNKRTAFVTAVLFLELNGYRLTATKEDRVLTFLSLAAGEVAEEELADWIRSNSEQRYEET